MNNKGCQSWFFGWALRHMGRCKNRQGWPALDAEGNPTEETVSWFAGWVKRFNDEGMTEPLAEQASITYAGTDYKWPSGKHLDDLIKIAIRIRAEKSRAGQSEMTIDQCRAVSRRCPECSGGGFAARPYNMLVGQEKNGDPIYRQYSMSFFCMCPMGEHLAQHYFKNDIDIYNRALRLVQCPELWDRSCRFEHWPVEPEPRDFVLQSGWVVPAAPSDESYVGPLDRIGYGGKRDEQPY